MIRVPIVSQMRHLRGIAAALLCALALATADAATGPAAASVEQAHVIMQRMATAQRQLQGYPQIMQLWRQGIPQYYCKPPKKPNRADDLQQLKQWEDEAQRLITRLNGWRAQLRRLATNQFVLNAIVAETGHDPDSTDFWTSYQTAIQNARSALAGAKNDVNSRPEYDCSPPEEEQEPQTESPPPDPLANAGIHQPTYREVPSVSVPAGPVCEDDYWDIVNRVGQARADAAFNSWQASLVVWSIADAIAKGKGPVDLLRQKETEARAELRRRDKIYDDLDALYTQAKALQIIDCTEQEPPQTESTPGTETGIPGDLGVDIPEPTFVPVDLPEIPEGPLCEEDKQKIVNAVYIQLNNTLTNRARAQSWLSAIRSALMSGRGNRAALIHARGRAVTTVRERNNAYKAADAAHKQAQAIPVKDCGEDDDRTSSAVGTGAAGACGTAAAEQHAGAQETRANAAQYSADYAWSASAGYKLRYGLKLEVGLNHDFWDDATDVAGEAVKDGAKRSETCLDADQSADAQTGGRTDVAIPNLGLKFNHNWLIWGSRLDRTWLNDRIGARFGTGGNYFSDFYQSGGVTQGAVQIPQSSATGEDVQNFFGGLLNDGRIGGFGHNYCREWFQIRVERDTTSPVATVTREQLESLPLNVRSIKGIAEIRPGVGLDGAKVTVRGVDPNPFAGTNPVWTANDALGPAYTTTDALGRYTIENIEVLRGGAAALYGQDAMAGVINVITKAGKKPAIGMLEVGKNWSSLSYPLTTDLFRTAAPSAAIDGDGYVPRLSSLPGVGNLFRDIRGGFGSSLGGGRAPEYIFLIEPHVLRGVEEE